MIKSIHFFIFAFLFSFNLHSTTYYVSSSEGKNYYHGKSISKPWRSLKKVNRRSFKPGDSILFKRGDVWRGQLIPKTSGESGKFIYFGAYGKGNKPLFLGSVPKNKPSKWREKQNHIWRVKVRRCKDVGNVILNSDVKLADKKASMDALVHENDFYFKKNMLYFKHNENPASFYSSIEVALRKHIVLVLNKSYLFFENIAIKYGAANGFSITDSSFITIKSCDVSYIGGGYLVNDSRYGNGIEFWQNAENCLVENCNIDQIFDSGLTNQALHGNVTQKNITYRNNVISNCGLSSYEYFSGGEGSVTDNIIFEKNTSKDVGYGWAPKRQYGYGRNHFLFHRNDALTTRMFFIDNDLYRSKSTAIAFYSSGVWSGFENLVFENNRYHNAKRDSYYFRFFTDGKGWENYKYKEKESLTRRFNKDKTSKFYFE